MIEITVDSIGQHGDGIAHFEGERLFVPFALPGEQIRAERDGSRANLIEVLTRSADRVDPPCPHFTQCGGCSLQHLAPAAYADFKRNLVADPLRRVGIELPVADLVDARGTGRRRTTLHVRGREAGYMRARSHDVFDLDTCPILVPGLAAVAPRIARALGPLAGQSEASFTLTDTGLDLSVRSERKLRSEQLASFAREHRLARLIFNGEPVYMARVPTIRMGKSTVELPPASFLQATAAAEEALATLVVAGVGSARNVADLFCGVGPFALRLAGQARVYAADSDRLAMTALQKAVNHTQGQKPVTTQVRDLFRDPLAPIELDRHDAVVFDPPRAGAEAQARELARSKVKTVVAVSCDPTSFARDAAILVAGGYKLISVVPVDQFAYAAHVELVAILRR
jgi:23S rRNA (uracil1939-C5)-methyltransferase